jgi:hypothetical protein
VDDVTAGIEGTLHFERYYTAEQRAELARRAEALGADGLRNAQEDWADLFRELDEARLEGLGPGHERVRALAARARELIRAFTGGDPGIQAGLERMYREVGGVAAMEHHGMGMTPALWEYYGRVMREASGG